MAGYIGQFLSPILFGPVVAGFGVRAVFASAAVVVATGLFGVTGAIYRRSRPPSD